MIHHFLPASPYSARFLELFAAHEEAFPPDRHAFWIEGSGDASFRVPAIGRSARHDVSAWGFVRAFAASRPADRFVIHQLSNPRLLLALAARPSLAARCAWSIWGGDVYAFLWRAGTLAGRRDEFLRRRVIPRIPLVSAMVPGDFETVRRVYGSGARFVRAFYPIPMDHALFDAVRDSGPSGGAGTTVLVGNSGDPANAHAEVLRALARHAAPDFRVLAPLAYGDAGYVERVCALGRELFGANFEALTGFLPPAQYAARIRGVDAAVMNHGYQQALGNIIALLLMGKKVFVRGDTTPYGYFNALGARVFDTRGLAALSREQLVAHDRAAALAGAEHVRADLSEANAVAGWRAVCAALEAGG